MKRFRSKLRIAVALAALVPLVGASGHPARAAVAASGTAQFSGSATLPTFPCQPAPPFGNGPCTGDFNGEWTGALSGVSGTSPFEVTWNTSDEPTAQITVNDFTYAEWDCNLGVAETVLGIARGTGTATAGPGQIDGNWYVVPNTFPRDITKVTLSFDFRWTRLATTAIIQLTRATLSLDVTGIGTVPVINSPQVGTATFVPTNTGPGGGVPSCTNQHPVVGMIAGALNFDGATT